MRSLKERLVENKAKNESLTDKRIAWARNNRIKSDQDLGAIWTQAIKQASKDYNVVDTVAPHKIPLWSGVFGMVKISGEQYQTGFDKYFELLTGVKSSKSERIGGVDTYYFDLAKDIPK